MSMIDKKAIKAFRKIDTVHGHCEECGEEITEDDDGLCDECAEAENDYEENDEDLPQASNASHYS